MYAIVEVGGQQFKVAKNDVILAPKIEGQEGETVALDRVMMIADENGIKLGNPVIAGAEVKALIMGFTRGKKVVIFKKKRKEGYKVKKGHRQDYTRLKIEDIVMN